MNLKGTTIVALTIAICATAIAITYGAFWYSEQVRIANRDTLIACTTTQDPPACIDALEDYNP